MSRLGRCVRKAILSLVGDLGKAAAVIGISKQSYPNNSGIGRLTIFAAAVAVGLAPTAIAYSQASSGMLAPASEVTVANSYRRDLTSKLNGLTYKLSIFLPRGYDPAKSERYPVLYFIPGDAYGVYFAQMTRSLSVGDIPKLIVVGIDFPSDESYSMDLPSAGHDPHWDVPENRGAANFLKILLKEIKPFVDKNFPTDPTDNGIGGHSLGGFFALYALLHEPQAFQHVYASSPSLVWQDFVLLRDEEALAHVTTDIHARVFVDKGQQEQANERFQELGRNIQSRNYPSLRWQSYVSPGQTHQTIAFADGIDALYSIYGPELRRPSNTELAALTGMYRSTNGEVFRIQADQGYLYAIGFRSDTPDERIELLSSKQNE